ncbi:hypothetical protein OS176_14495, partial [Xanthomonadaceae bacterium XH05]|nr:hypothetical protein [Xanthomonadaceae bacterium XH05]
MTQWVKEETRFRGEDTPARLDLLLTKEPDVIEYLKYMCPIGKSDHVVIEFQMIIGNVVPRDEFYRQGRYNFGKADFVGLRKFFENA